MRKLIFAITKQCDERISEEAYHLESRIFFYIILDLDALNSIIRFCIDCRI